MKFGKWIGGGVGWALFGPIGALLGFVFGAAMDNINISVQPMQNQTQQGDFIASLLVLTSAVMKADGKVVKSELDDLLRQADFVSIHTPLTPETKGLMNTDRFRLMKPTAVIINTSRGPVIEEKALVKALEEGWIAGAALDVLHMEPPKHNPFTRMKNVILTPHAGFYSEEAVEELRATADLEVKRVLTGHHPNHLVNPHVSEYIKRR